jgi:hypothetical protein
MDNEINAIKQKIKRELADFLGIGLDDIEDESEFISDFHMSPTDMTDFLDILNKSGFDTDSIELTQIETFSDLIDSFI